MVRFKNRYLLVEVIPFKGVPEPALPPKKARISDFVEKEQGAKAEFKNAPNLGLSKLSSTSAAAHIRQSLEANFGLDASAINSQSLSVKYCNSKTGMLLVRVARDQLQKVWASLTFITDIPGQASNSSERYSWNVMHTSGTIRSSQKVAIKLSAQKIDAAYSMASTDTGTLSPFYMQLISCLLDKKALRQMLLEAERLISAIEA